jgi:hypothetical protein
MAILNIRVDNHDQKGTVSEMRKKLFAILNRLDGDQEVSFSFRATVEVKCYSPAPEPTIVLGELARPENE